MHRGTSSTLSPANSEESPCPTAPGQIPSVPKATTASTGTDADGNAYIAVVAQEEHYLTDSRDAFRTLIRDIKAGKADHLLRLLHGTT
jgi:hypothetical protein